MASAVWGVTSLCFLPAGTERCPYIHQLSVRSFALHPCWRTFPLGLYPIYCCTRQGVGMSLAQVIFVLTQSSPRETCSVMGELQG